MHGNWVIISLVQHNNTRRKERRIVALIELKHLTKTFKEADVSEDLRQTASELNKEVNEMRETVAKAANDVRTDIEGGNNK